MKTRFYLFKLFAFLCINVYLSAQDITQTIKGKVVDRESHFPLIGATVIIPGTEPLKATISDTEGNFRLHGVPVGRYTIQINYVGYQSLQIPEVLVSTGKEVQLSVELSESVTTIEEIGIKANSQKDRPLNPMATISARSFSVEETSRYAGGLDDPARLVSSFAGITTGSLQDNSIVIRGNAPKGILWRLEGVPIPNPNHFAGAISAGGGFVTIFSNQMLSNSDFFTGAFPAEYGNAMAGVFDMKFRNGNNEKREYWFQAGTMGLDAGTEGPFKKGGKASYLFNYRYSTFGLLMPLFPKGAGLPAYQDLSYKLHLPTQKAGVLTLWGIGAIDNMLKYEETDSTEWVSYYSKEREETHMKPAAAGLTHKYIFGEKTYVNTTLAATNYSGGHLVHRFDDQLELHQIQHIDIRERKLIAHSLINHKFSAAHTNRTGVIYNHLFYSIALDATTVPGTPMTHFVDNYGDSYLIQAYSQSMLRFGNNLTLNIGVHGQYFGLNGNYSIEPRAGIRWDMSHRQALSLGFGKHSQTEDLKLYLAENNGGTPNRNLEFTKALHFVMGYDLKISDHLRFKVEPYYQYLYDVPVIPDSSYSLINFHQQWFMNDALVNEGTGTNIGIDLTLERFLENGIYWLATASVFDSKYTGGDGIERNSAYDRGIVANFLFGKEIELRPKGNKRRTLSLNGKINYLGGERLMNVLKDESLEAKDIIWDTRHVYERKADPSVFSSVSVSYRKNKPRHTSTLSLQVINVFASPSSNDDFYNLKEQKLDVDRTSIVVPNLSYKIEF